MHVAEGAVNQQFSDGLFLKLRLSFYYNSGDAVRNGEFSAPCRPSKGGQAERRQVVIPRSGES